MVLCWHNGHVLLIFMSALLLPCHADCEKGFFGKNCEFKCHCKAGDCDDGRCSEGCAVGYIGPDCQYRSYRPTLEGSKVNWLGDGNPSTCNDGRLAVVKATLHYMNTVTWIRVKVKRKVYLDKLLIQMFNKRNPNDGTPCLRNLAPRVDDTTMDVACYAKKLVHYILITREGAKHLCELEISPGRNIVFRQSMVSIIYEGMAIPAGLAVDGKIDTCPRLYNGNGKTLEVSLPAKAETNRMKIFVDSGASTKYKLKTFGSWSRHSSMFQWSGQRGRSSIRVVPTRKLLNTVLITIAVDRDATGQNLTFPICELEVLGELDCIRNPSVTGCLERYGYREDCDKNAYGLACEHVCSVGCASNGNRRRCDKYTGVCTAKGCQQSYLGPKCDRCRRGTYGKNCAKNCSKFCSGKAPSCDVQTGHCSPCLPGYTGDRCEKICESGRYGQGCSHECSSHCKSKFGRKDCDFREGRCEHGCYPGYKGAKCIDACEAGTYGKNCLSNCSVGCISGSCRISDGACLEGCEPGYAGLYCEMCEDGKFGMDCLEACSQHCMEGSERLCSHVDGVCGNGCNSGYRGLTCEDGCPKFMFGRSCAYGCSNRCSGSLCDPVTGDCLSCPPGAIGQRCDEACPTGMFGLNCNDRCPANCPELCDGATGNCVDCMSLGKAGPKCDQDCPSGRFGLGCQQYCTTHCRGGEASCNPVDGTCKQGCASHFKPPFCKVCLEGHYGENCSILCSSNCLDGKCHPDTGVCLNCPKGRRGATCSSECPPGYHGNSCEQECSDGCFEGVCDMVTGHCRDCILGREGKFCLKEMDDESEFKLPGGGALGPLTFAVAMAMLIVILILMAKVQREEQRKRQLLFRQRGGWSSGDEGDRDSSRDYESKLEVGMSKQELRSDHKRSSSGQTRPSTNDNTNTSTFSQSSQGSQVDPSNVPKFSQTYEYSSEKSITSDSDL